ncbi:MAG: NAD(P)H-dependent oxidoreductase subunit E [Candidatus Aminicenantes bacterium]|nr:NAD(P)H-dependent oxidoreductase subunit E [Candidatus Aminicenantes bacterium]
MKVESNLSLAQEIINKYKGQKKALITILQEIQNVYHYLPEPVLRLVSKKLNLPLIDVISVATFYRAFSLKPRGRHQITVCLGTACHVRGGFKVLEEFEKQLNLKAGETSPDNQFTLETVNCLGCCAIGPVVVVDGNYYAQTTTRKVSRILKPLTKEKL